MSSPADPGT